MKIKKTLSIFALLILLSTILSGCGYQLDVIINDNVATAEYKYYATAQEQKSILSSLSKNTKKEYNDFEELMATLGLSKAENMKINKKKHNCYSISTDYSADEFNNIFISYNSKYATLSADDITNKTYDNFKTLVTVKNTKLDYCVINITYPYEVVKANGQISSDGYTVSYNISKKKSSEKRFWAIFKTNMKSTLKFKGLNSDSKYYKKDVTVKLSNLATSFKINNIEQYTDEYTFDTDGKYTLQATNVNGKVTTSSIIVDKTKPITNVKNKSYKQIQITYSDATSGIKSAKLNGKKIWSGIKVSKSGDYKLVLTDYAGNKKTVKFKIK